MIGLNIDFHDPDPAKQLEGNFAIGVLKGCTEFQLHCAREVWFGSKDKPQDPPDPPDQPDAFDYALNFALGDDIYQI